jgi:hypothetical protein
MSASVSVGYETHLAERLNWANSSNTSSRPFYYVERINIPAIRDELGAIDWIVLIIMPPPYLEILFRQWEH